MPNLERYEFRYDGAGDWVAVAGTAGTRGAGHTGLLAEVDILWPLHAGTNTIEVRAVSCFEVAGPPAQLQVDLTVLSS